MIDHFGFLAPFYDRLLPYREDGFLQELANLPQRGKILDAGGGTGRVASTLVRDGLQVVVMDFSFKMLSQAAAKGLRTTCAATEHLPFAQDTFDRILVVDAFHHLADQRQTAVELWRVLRPGGRIVILEPDIERLAVRVLALGEKLALMRSHFLRLAQIQALFPFEGARLSGRKYRYQIGVVIEKVR